ncbi:hypothetical protein [Streptomyces sp. ISL-11]|uniref:hypothetical protein n=1 Tax=Streptomyces sp. ISL-11 TaxID=2819174 RepID=UPI001BEA6A6F|nr:hypothetical protein [Streptomyces sp. ISL-11]MBT2382672.1 hypothetical protein [Streptomyces sp. ISL-11]
MDSVRRALCGALATVAFCAVPAYAEDGPATMSGTIELTPVSSHPGGRIQLRVAGCANDTALATSEAFTADARLAKDSAGLFAEAAVRQTVAPGTYGVKVNCAGHDAEAQGRLTIVENGRALPENRHGGVAPGHVRRDKPTARVASPAAPAAPVAPVPAGGGGTATTATAEPPDTPGLVLAGAAALIAAGLIWHRRRAETKRK